MGIQVHTTNQEGQSAKDMGELWGRFYAENIMSRIKHPAGSEVYVIYTNYESDYHGKYTAIIGLKVDTIENTPDGLVNWELKGGNYTKIMVKGLMPDAIIASWKKIWSADKELRREYTADFEVYGPEFQNDSESEMEIYIATK
jgi:predicted transcriptional regulator YdeE